LAALIASRRFPLPINGMAAGDRSRRDRYGAPRIFLAETIDPQSRSPEPIPRAGPMNAPAQTTLPTSPERLLAMLVELGIEAATHAHSPVFTVEEAKALRGTLPGGHIKNLFLRNKKERCGWSWPARTRRSISRRWASALAPDA
jgi:hypothetical protein